MMRYLSTRGEKYTTLEEVISRSLALDGGLYMPEQIPKLPGSFFDKLPSLSLQEIGFEVAKRFFEEDIPPPALRRLIEETLAFDCPVVSISGNVRALELFHGPTLAFKDVGARFLARLFQYFSKKSGKQINVLAATSGDTGSAVAQAFYRLSGVHVFILYPKGLVSEIQERQFTTLGGNIHALEIEGTFDDCQKLVKEAFLDNELNQMFFLTSANSINLARLLPQSFYYFRAFAQLPPSEWEETAVSVPSGNFGNLCAGLIARQMGLPISQMIAATNANEVVPQFLRSGEFSPKPSIPTVANAMDVGNPSNFERILYLYSHSLQRIQKAFLGYSYSDEEIISAIQEVYQKDDYLLDPHGATGYLAVTEYAGKSNAKGLFLATAHPAKFVKTIEAAINTQIPLPHQLATRLALPKIADLLPAQYDALKKYLIKANA